MSKFFEIFKKKKIVTTGDNNIPVEEENESHSMLTDVSVGLTLTAENESCSDTDVTDLGNLISGPMQPLFRLGSQLYLFYILRGIYPII